MGRGDRKAKPLRELKPIKSRKLQPRENGRFAKPHEDPRMPALAVRARLFSQKADLKNMAAQHMGSDIGRAIQACEPDDVARLWSVWQAWCMAEWTYSMRINSQTGSPKGSSIAFLPERIETDTGHTIDTRTPDQRDADAIRGWMIWRGYLGQLDAHEATALHHARREDGPPIWADCRPTVHGQVALDALKRLADVVEGK